MCKKASSLSNGLKINGKKYIFPTYKTGSKKSKERFLEDTKKRTGSILEMSDEDQPIEDIDRVCIESQRPDMLCKLEKERAEHKLIFSKVKGSLDAGIETFKRKKSILDDRIYVLTNEIKPLQNIHCKKGISLGRFQISFGTIVTMLCIVIDWATNFSNMAKMPGNKYMIYLIVTLLCLMNNGSMWYYANVKNSTYLDEPGKKKSSRYYLITFLCFFFFIATSAIAMAHRFLNIDNLFPLSSFDAETEEEIIRNGHDIGEWLLVTVISLITPFTGCASLICSLDKNAAKVEKRRRLEKELAQVEKEQQKINAELSYLEDIDVDEIQQQGYESALASVNRMIIDAKLSLREDAIRRQASPEYTDNLLHSAKLLLDSEIETSESKYDKDFEDDDSPNIDLLHFVPAIN